MAFMFGYSNLVVKNGTDTNNTVNMTADWIAVDDGSGNTLRVPMTTTVTVDKSDATQTSTKPNGRDQKDMFPASTTTPTVTYVWIHIWAIYNPVTNTVAGLFSLSATSPTLPSGYTHKAYVGAVYNDNSGYFISFSQVDNKVVRPISGGYATSSLTYVSTLTAAAAPSTAKAISGFMSMQAAVAGGGVIYVSPTSDGMGEQRMYCPYGATTSYQNNFRIPLITPQTAYSKIDNTTGNTGSYFVTGWEY